MTDPILVLVVEDEFAIAELVRHALQDAGFETIAAADGQQALEALDGGGGGLRALVTDIRLGSPADGWYVATRAREVAPEIAVVYMTGDSGADWSARGVPHSVLVHKPFVPAQIVMAVCGLLNFGDRR